MITVNKADIPRSRYDIRVSDNDHMSLIIFGFIKGLTGLDPDHSGHTWDEEKNVSVSYYSCWLTDEQALKLIGFTVEINDDSQYKSNTERDKI